MTSPTLLSLAGRVEPFWSDDFDMDLPKIFPDALRLLGDLSVVELVTVGTPDKNGRLNHPSVWNGDQSMLAFFGFSNPARDLFYAAPSSVEVRCTAWELFRDAWEHHYTAHVERRPIWNTFDLMREFDAIMYDLRGWKTDVKARRKAERRVMNSYCEAVRQFGYIVERYPAVLARARSALEESHG